MVLEDEELVVEELLLTMGGTPLLEGIVACMVVEWMELWSPPLVF